MKYQYYIISGCGWFLINMFLVLLWNRFGGVQPTHCPSLYVGMFILIVELFAALFALKKADRE